MTLDISMLNNPFPLDTKTQNYYLKHPSLLRYMS